MKHKIMQMQERNILEQIAGSCVRILKDNLTGIYIHGSLAFGCFHWAKSDIDFIIVTKSSPTQQEKERLIAALLEIDSKCPPKGLEMSLVLEQYCHHFVYPTPFELHFSNAHKEKCRMNLNAYCRNMNGADKDLAAHFTVIREVGITLWGKEIRSVFDEIPREDYLDSIRNDIEDAVNEITENPVYIILNLCRVLAYIKNGLVLSKEQGAQWGLENLSGVYRDIIKEAVNCYRTDNLFPTGISENTLREFAEYMLQPIFCK